MTTRFVRIVIPLFVLVSLTAIVVACSGSEQDKKKISEGITLQDTSVFSGRLVTLETKKLTEGESEIIVDIDLPRGYKLAENVPFDLDWSTAGDPVVTFGTQPGDEKLSSRSFPFYLPLTCRAGKVQLTIDAVVYICENNSTICVADNVRLKLPLEITDGAPSRLALSIPISAPDSRF